MARKKKGRYDDKFRASAVVMLEAAGYPDKKGALVRVAGQLGIPHATLSRWANKKRNPPPSDLVQEKKAELSDLLRNELEGILGDMPDARQDASYRDLGTVAGILFDKLQLIGGQPTEIIGDTVEGWKRKHQKLDRQFLETLDDFDESAANE